MSLDIYFTQMKPTIVFDTNITHNMNKMAEAAGIYRVLWRPEEININKACEMIPQLEIGLAALKADPEKFKAYNSPNGWGMYEHFVPFVEQVLAAAKEHPEAEVRVSI